jgi:hypothetical protein
MKTQLLGVFFIVGLKDEKLRSNSWLANQLLAREPREPRSEVTSNLRGGGQCFHVHCPLAPLGLGPRALPTARGC